MGKHFCASRKSSFPLLSQDCRQAPAHVRLLHPSPKTHRVPVWVQQDYEVTKLINKRWETDVMIQQSKTIKMRSTIEQRETACDTSRNGWRSSQIISKIQKCQHSQTLLMTQIRNVLRKLQPGRTVFILTSQKTEIAKPASNQDDKGSLQEAKWRSSTSGRKKLVT